MFGDTSLPRIGGYNRAVLLDAIRRHEGISRAELAEQAGLTSQTVSAIVRRLLSDGLVLESGTTTSRGGKPRTTLRMNPTAFYAVGVHLDPDAVVTVLVDLSGRIVARARPHAPRAHRPATVVRRIARGIEQCLTDSGVRRSRVLGVGLASPGPINQEHGQVLGPPNLTGWGDEPLGGQLATLVELPVVLDNDATAAAIGEQWAGDPSRNGSFVFIYLGTGIGGGLMLRDGIYRGESGNAGEIGHVIVAPGGARCTCGARGCLEAQCSPGALVTQAIAAMGASEATALGLSGVPTRRGQDYAHLCRAVEAQHPAARAVMIHAAKLIAQACISVVNLFDTTLIVFGGEPSAAVIDLICRRVEQTVNDQTLARRVRTVSVEASTVGPDVCAVGAASLVLHGNYAPGWQRLRREGV